MKIIKDFATYFWSLTLHTVNLLLWKKVLILLYSFQNYHSNKTKHTPHGGSGFATKGETGEDSKPLHKKIDCYPFPLCLTPSLLWLQTTYWKKVSPIAFGQILPKILPMVHILSFIITTYFKKFIGIKTLSTKQYPAELSPWSIPTVFPILPKMFSLLSFCLLPPPCMECPTSSPKPTIWRKPSRWGRIPPHFPHRKNPLLQIAILT